MPSVLAGHQPPLSSVTLVLGLGLYDVSLDLQNKLKGDRNKGVLYRMTTHSWKTS